MPKGNKKANKKGKKQLTGHKVSGKAGSNGRSDASKDKSNPHRKSEHSAENLKKTPCKAEDKFRQALRIKSNISFNLDPECVKQLGSLLEKVPVENYPDIFSASLLSKDVEALHVLLLALPANVLNTLLQKQNLFNMIDLLKVPLVLPGEASSGMMPKLVAATLKRSLEKKLKAISPEDFQKILESYRFNITALSTAYITNVFLETAKYHNLELLFFRFRDELFTHACRNDLLCLVFFCSVNAILPNPLTIDLIAGEHSPLAVMSEFSCANKEVLRERLIADFSSLGDIPVLCSLELLGACYKLKQPEDPAIDKIISQLVATLSNNSLSQAVSKLFSFTLVFEVFNEHVPLRDLLEPTVLREVFIKTGGLLTLSQPERDVDLDEALLAFEKEITHFIREGLMGAVFFAYSAAKTFAECFKRRAVISDACLKASLPFLIRERQFEALEDLSRRFNAQFVRVLQEAFPKGTLFGFSGVLPLEVAMRDGHAKTIASLAYPLLDNNVINIENFSGPGFARLLRFFLSLAPPGCEHIRLLLKVAPDVYCDTDVIFSLINLSYVQLPNSGVLQCQDRLLLQSAVRLGASIFMDPFFNFCGGMIRLSVSQLEDLRLAAQALAEEVGADSNVYTKLKDKIGEAKALQALSDDPCFGLSEERGPIKEYIQGGTLFQLFSDPQALSAGVEEQWLVRRILYLQAQENGIEILKEELLEQGTVEYKVWVDGEEVTKTLTGSLIALLCYKENSLPLKLALNFCLGMKVGTITEDGTVLSPVHTLAREGLLSLLQRLLQYIASADEKEAVFSELAVRGTISTMYCICKVRSDSSIGALVDAILQDGEASLSRDYYTDVCRAQIVGVLELMLDNGSVGAAAQKKLKALQGRMHAMMAGSLFETAIEIKDAFLVYLAIKMEHGGNLPSALREKALRILLLDPSRLLARQLALTDAEILDGLCLPEDGYFVKRTYPEIFLLQFESFFLSWDLNKAMACLELLADMFCQVHALPEYYVLFLLKANRFKGCLSAMEDQLIAVCAQVLQHGKTPVPPTRMIPEKCWPLLADAYGRFDRAKSNEVMTCLDLASEKEALKRQYLAEASRPSEKFPPWKVRDIQLLVKHHFSSQAENIPFPQLLKNGAWFCAAIYIEAGEPLTGNLTFYQLCLLLSEARFLPRGQDKLIAAVEARLRSHPEEVNKEDVVHKLPAGFLLTQARQEALLNALMSSPALTRLSHFNGTAILSVSICDAGFSLAVLQKSFSLIPRSTGLQFFLKPGSRKGRSPLYLFYLYSNLNPEKSRPAKDFLTFFLEAQVNLLQYDIDALLDLLVLMRALGFPKNIEDKSAKNQLNKMDKAIKQIFETYGLNPLTLLLQREEDQAILSLLSDDVWMAEIIRAEHIDPLFALYKKYLHVPLMQVLEKALERFTLTLAVVEGFWTDLHANLDETAGNAKALVGLARFVCSHLPVLTVNDQSEGVKFCKKVLRNTREMLDLTPLVVALNLPQEDFRALALISAKVKLPEVLLAYCERFAESEAFFAGLDALVLAKFIVQFSHHLEGANLLNKALGKVSADDPGMLIDVLDGLDEGQFSKVKLPRNVPKRLLSTMQAYKDSKTGAVPFRRVLLEAYRVKCMNVLASAKAVKARSPFGKSASAEARATEIAALALLKESQEAHLAELSHDTLVTYFMGADAFVVEIAAYQHSLFLLDKKRQAIEQAIEAEVIAAIEAEVIEAEVIEAEVIAAIEAEVIAAIEAEATEAIEAKVTEAREAEATEALCTFETFVVDYCKKATAALQKKQQDRFSASGSAGHFQPVEQGGSRRLGNAEVSQRPAITPEVIACRVQLVSCERGYLLEFTDKASGYVASKTPLYLDPNGLSLKADLPAAVCLSGSGQWTLLQEREVTKGVNVRPEEAGTVTLMKNPKEKTSVEVFLGGVNQSVIEEQSATEQQSVIEEQSATEQQSVIKKSSQGRRSHAIPIVKPPEPKKSSNLGPG